MSTRACIARSDITGHESWKGVYCHWDGYPNGLGKEIGDVLQRDFIHSEGRLGVLNSKGPHNAISAFCDIYISGHPGGWSTFNDICYCHDPAFVMRDGIESGEMSSSEHSDWIEWVYVLDPIKATMQIQAVDESFECQDVAEIDLLGPEPNWHEIKILASS